MNDMYAFPVPHPSNYNGMSYRQWLIGQALVGAMAFPGTTRIEHIAQGAIQVADAVIAMLDAEKKNV